MNDKLSMTRTFCDEWCTYLKQWNCTNSYKNHYPNVYLGSKSSPVVGVVMAVVFLWVVQHVVIVLTQFFILKVTILEIYLADMTKAENTLPNCQVDYACNLVLTTDRAQLDRVCSSWAQSLFAVGKKSQCVVSKYYNFRIQEPVIACRFQKYIF